MAVSPTDSTPILQPRPKGPGNVRPKRASWQPSGTPSPRSSPALRSSALLDKDLSRSGRSTPEQFTGTLAERTEDQLMRASRDALQDAIRKEWSHNEKLISQVDDMTTAQRDHQARVAEMESANIALQDKFDASFAAQGDMEEQLEGANDLIDHLRHNLEDVERQLRQGQRRYADQEKAFEAERMVHQAEQNHLVHRIKSLTTERIARPSAEDGDMSAATAALQEELITLSASHQTLVAQLTTLADEMHEIKSENSRLIEENESWQLLIEERTLAGHMRGGLIPGTSPSPPPADGVITPSSIQRKEPSALETLEEQLEMDELHSELEAQQPIFEESDRALLRVTSGGSYNMDLISPTRTNGHSLATEFGVQAEVEDLRAQIKTLKEANKALSLYCSKILDRIIASEGFEHVLSVDYRTRRGTRTLANGKIRPSVLELAKDMEKNGPPPLPESLPQPASMEPPPSSQPPAPRARPQSMYVTSSATPATPHATEAPAPIASKAPPPAKDADKDKRARRGFSIDFRSLGFGAQEKPEPKPQLKPLQLASRAAPAGQSPPKAQSSPAVAVGPSFASAVPGIPGARKLAPQQEDEEDRRERSRMEANLKLMGIASPSSETASFEEKPSTPSATAASGAAGWFSRRLSRASVPVAQAEAQRGSTTSLSRLSATPSDSSMRAELDADPEAAMRAFDAREREQARLLAEGKNATPFTAPPKPSLRRNRSSNGSTLSRHSAQSFCMSGTSSATSPSVGDGGGAVETIADKPPATSPSHHRARESISTLWSMGSSHDHE
ncbi:uncharacterized protein CcaverHIS019_0608590 [Cutaneotrichosporon cavernicola]|uniref:Uncharacterized protein n=1 Tax=Cutaneotrichosporon cavernicola TaxID=279322 RepID=A0AA48L9J0_9TREE|nr:uncharacterized protein CcaverHIS019_0608590 [Cutaneotrichosporon cavernicola]BEI94400.1 hypothetical protein CcaverHIS019_0608590 [Cutaneotrichosporon cavernicola]BEJ02177.1 hypothetical protein CcaverHIS631_0608590 [Cutaneotrichosporon cavernicola]BEJ09938.1 hypothetical protein CcaverHIS641_0608530 [Cutaneotrichosporon cavernicola]